MRSCSSKFSPGGSVRRGVTLLETVLAMGILILVSSMTYWFYSSVLRTSDQGTGAAYRLRLTRVVLDRIATEIRQAAAITADNRVGIRGEAERIWLSSYRVPSREQSKARSVRDESRPGEYDLSKVEYKIARHPEILHEDGYEFPLGLARVEIRVPRLDSAQTGEAFEGERFIVNADDSEDGFEEARLEEELFGDEEEGDVSLEPTINWEELYAPELRYLRFCYYDGNKWWDSWEVAGESPLPQLMQVTVGFEGHPPYGEEFGLDEVNEEFCECLNQDPVDCVPLAEDQFSTVVRVPQADPLFRSRVSRETQALVEEFSGGAEP